MASSSPNIRDMLDKATQRIMQLEVENLQYKIKLTNLGQELGQLKTERREDKYVIYTVDMLTRGATPSKWASPAHIRHIISVCQKYEYIVADIKKVEPLASWQFVMAWCLNTGLDPNFHCDNDKNGYWDDGVGDINDVAKPGIEKDLPEHLKKANWHNIDKSVAAVYVYIKHCYKRRPWAILNYEQWQYYARLKGVQDEIVLK